MDTMLDEAERDRGGALVAAAREQGGSALRYVARRRAPVALAAAALGSAGWPLPAGAASGGSAAGHCRVSRRPGRIWRGPRRRYWPAARPGGFIRAAIRSAPRRS